MATRTGRARWEGDLPSGHGELEIGDGVFKGSYSFQSRFEEGEGDVPGIDEAHFREHAEQAKAGCPISKTLAAVDEIILETKLGG